MLKIKSIKEKRFFAVNGLNVRSEQTESGDKYIEGYAALFNHPSKLLAEYKDNKPIVFTERILAGSFDEVLKSNALNVIHTIDHDRSKMLGRSISGTLELSVDEKGLKYRVKVPNTTLGQDTYELISRGDLFESSFVFTVDKDGEQWEQRDGENHRTISKVSGLYDTSTVCDGAYSQTAVTIARSAEEFQDVETPKVEEQVNDLDKIDLEIEIFANG